MTIARGSRSCWIGAVLSSLAASPALALDESTPQRAVMVTAPRCAKKLESMELLLRSLEVELAASALEPRATDDGSRALAARVVLHAPECSLGAATVSFEVQTDSAPFGLRRSVPLADVPASARARTLAITIAESLREALEVPPAAIRAPAEVPAAVNDERRATANDQKRTVTGSEQASSGEGSASSTHLGAAAHGRFSFESSAPFLGVELNLKIPLSDYVALSFETAYAATRDRVTFDDFSLDFDMDFWSVALGPDFVAGEAPRLSIGPRLGLGQFGMQSGFFSDSAFSSVGYGVASLVASAGLRGSASMPIGDVVTLDASVDVHHMWGALPILDLGASQAGIPLPGYAYENPPPPEPERLGLYPWMATLGIGVGFRM